MSRFIVYKPTKQDVAEALSRSQKLGITPSSFTRGKGRMVGFLGEVAFEKVFPKAVYVGDRSYTHDYELNGMNIDVKAKSCNSRPMLHYNASVPTRKNKKLPKGNIYVFMRVRTDFSRVWLCGWTTQQALEKPKYFKRKGESDNTGFTFLSDGYHLPIRNTRRTDSLVG